MIPRALYLRGDPYVSSDAVFGVKQSLIVDLEPADAATAGKYGVKEGTSTLRHDFVLVSDQEARELRELKSRQALEKLGRKVKLVDSLPIPDLD